MLLSTPPNRTRPPSPSPSPTAGCLADSPAVSCHALRRMELASRRSLSASDAMVTSTSTTAATKRPEGDRLARVTAPTMRMVNRALREEEVYEGSGTPAVKGAGRRVSVTASLPR